MTATMTELERDLAAMRRNWQATPAPKGLPEAIQRQFPPKPVRLDEMAAGQRAALQRLAEMVGIPADDLDTEASLDEVWQRHWDYAAQAYIPGAGDWVAYESFLRMVRAWAESRGTVRFVDDPIGD
jgi:hypothetical protein